MLEFNNVGYFRQQLVCSTLSGKAVRIKNIRSQLDEPGLVPMEANFLKLLDKLTNGSFIEINETGTELYYKPGMIVGGSLSHDCSTSRSIGWYLEAILALAPFAKYPLNMTLTGITNDDIDPSIDHYKSTTIPLLKHFGLEHGLELKLVKRGAPPNGGGEVRFTCPILRELKSIYLVDAGFVKRIRGMAYCAKVSPQTANRMVDTARGIFNNAIPDVYIYTDHCKGAMGGSSPGFALNVVAETTTGMVLGAEAAANGGTLPEQVATYASYALCEEIKKGGCIDSSNIPLTLLLMALSPEDVSKVRIGKLNPYSIEMLRHLRAFFGTTFKIKADGNSKTVLLSCLGTGYKNLSKKVT